MEQLVLAVAGALISLFWSFFPIVRQWFQGLSDQHKALLNLGVVLLAAALIAGSSCLDLWVAMSCDQSGFMTLGEAVLVVLLGNQITFGATKSLRPGIERG